MKKLCLIISLMLIISSFCCEAVFAQDGYVSILSSSCSSLDDNIDNAVNKNLSNLETSSTKVPGETVIMAKGTFANTSTLGDNDYLQFNVNNDLNSGNYDYAVVEFDVLLDAEKNSVSVMFNLPSKSSSMCRVFIENEVNIKNVWESYKGGLRSNAFVSKSEWHKVSVAIPMYGSNIVDAETGILKDEYKNVRIFVEGKEATYGPKKIELPLTVKPSNVFSENGSIKIGFATQGKTTQNYEAYIDNISIKGYVGADLPFDKPQPKTTEIVSNADFMSGRSLSDISAVTLEGVSYTSVLKGAKQATYTLTDEQKESIAKDDVMLLEAVVRTDGGGGKISFDINKTDGNFYLSNDSYNMYIDSADSGKNLYYTTPSWSRISMPYISEGNENSIKIDMTENTMIASVTLSKVIEKENDSNGNVKINDFVMFERSGMYDLSGAEEKAVTETFDKTISAATDTVCSFDGQYLYTVGGGSLYISSLENPEKPSVVGKLTGLGALRQIALSDKNPDILIVTGRQCGVTFIDVRDKSNPKKIGRYDTIEFATGICISGDYMFIANRVFGVEIADISDYTNVSEEKRAEDGIYKNAQAKEIAIARCGEAQSCTVNSGILYAGLWGEHRIDMFDLRTDISNPKKIGEIRLSGKGDGMTVEEKDGKTYLYAATGHHTYQPASGTEIRKNLQVGQGNGFDIFDVTDIINNGANGNQIHLSTVRADGRFSYSLYDYWSVKRAEKNGKDYIYFGSSLNGFYIYDVTDKSAPKRVSHTVLNISGGTKLTGEIIPYDQTDFTRSPVCGFDTVNGYVYVGGTLSGVYVLNSDFASKKSLMATDTVFTGTDSFYNLSLPDGIADVTYYRKSDEQIQSAKVVRTDGNDYIVAACGTGGIKIFDNNLNVINTYPANDMVSDVYIVGDTLYAADGQAGLRFFKIEGTSLSEIGTPFIRSSESYPVKEVIVTSDKKWAVIQAGLRVQVVNVSNPDNPTFYNQLGASVYIRPIMQGFIKDTNAYGAEYDRYAVAYGYNKKGYLVDFSEENPIITGFGSVSAAGIGGGLAVYSDGKTIIATGVGSDITRYLIIDGYSDFANITSSYKFPWKNRVYKNADDNLPDVLSGKPYIFGNIMVVSDMLEGYVSVINISDIKNPKTVSSFKINGTPNIAYATDDYVILTLGYQGIAKITFDKSSAKTDFAKSGITVSNENGIISTYAKVGLTDDKSAKFIAVKYKKDGAVSGVEFLTEINYGSVSEKFEIANSEGYTKIFLLNSDIIAPLSECKTVKQ